MHLNIIMAQFWLKIQQPFFIHQKSDCFYILDCLIQYYGQTSLYVYGHILPKSLVVNNQGSIIIIHEYFIYELLCFSL